MDPWRPTPVSTGKLRPIGAARADARRVIRGGIALAMSRCMGAAATRHEETGKFVGQVLGRATPKLEFRSSQKPLPIHGPNGTPEAEMAAEADVEDAPHREPAESEVRLSRKPTLRLPVVPRLVRHTRLDLKLFAPRAEPSRALGRLARAALSVAAVLMLLALAAIVARAVPGDRVNARASLALLDAVAAPGPRAEKSTFEHQRTLDDGPADRLVQLTQEEEDLTVPAEAAVSTHASIARATPSHAHPRTPRVAPRHRAHSTTAPARGPRPASHARPVKH
jgi:hypothetical protein